MARSEALRRTALSSSLGPLDYLRHLADFWNRRDLLWHMTIRHLRGQYKQSVLGYAWAFVNPLSQMLIMSFVFSTILRVGDRRATRRIRCSSSWAWCRGCSSRRRWRPAPTP